MGKIKWKSCQLVFKSKSNLFFINFLISEGLMYNPVNMKIEDEKRLYERDLREKNKRKRFEVRYDVEAKTRKDGFSE